MSAVLTRLSSLGAAAGDGRYYARPEKLQEVLALGGAGIQVRAGGLTPLHSLIEW